MPRIGIGLPIGRRKSFRRQRTMAVQGRSVKVVVTPHYYWDTLEAWIVRIDGRKFRRNRIFQGRLLGWEEAMESAVQEFMREAEKEA